jgi:O-antigen ligase
MVLGTDKFLLSEDAAHRRFSLAKKEMQMRAADWNVLLIAALEFSILFSSQYRANGVRTSALITLSVLTFFVARVTIRRPLQMACLGGVVGLGGALLGLNAMRQFIAETELLASVGFSNLLAFRSQMIVPPAPWVAGEWFTVVLLALPFACAMPTYLWRREKTWPAVIAMLPPLVVTAALALSMSRAIFLSTVLFYFSGCVLLVLSKIVSLRAGSTLLAGGLGSLVLILACESAIYPGLIKTYVGQHTSQTRSTQGRVEIWNRSLELVLAHPLVGVGSANSALMLLSSADEEETTGFASRTFSLPIQILVEKGVTGLVLYTVFLALVTREFVQTIRHSAPVRDPDEIASEPNQPVAKQRRTQVVAEAKDDSACKAMLCCFAAGLIAVLFRELTYSSLMEHSLTLALAAVLAALICRPQAD